MVLLFAIALLTRTYLLAWPGDVVYDEIYFARSVHDYHQGTLFFDLHPPFAKLVLWVSGELKGLPDEPLTFTFNQPFPPGFPYVTLRLVVAIVGSLLVPLLYLFTRGMGGGSFAGILAAGLGLLDNALLVQSRFILLDAFLLVFGLGGVLCVMASERLRSHRFLLLASGILLVSFAVNIKVTGLGFWALAALMWGTGVWLRRKGVQKKKRGSFVLRALREGVCFLLMPVVLTVVFLAVHLVLLTRSGTGDAFFSPSFQAALEGSKVPEGTVPSSFTSRLWESEKVSFLAQRTVGPHSYSSQWYTWPLMVRPVYGWHREGLGPEGDQEGRIYLQGNPFIWWFSTAVVALFLLVGWEVVPARIYLLLTAAYLGNLLPHVLITRPMFLYHYFPSLLFAITATGLIVPQILPSKRWARASVTVVLLISAVTFIYFAPLSYGLPLTEKAFHARLWLPSWQ